MSTDSGMQTSPELHIPGVIEVLARHGIRYRIIPAQSAEDSRLTEWRRRAFPFVHSQVDWTRIEDHECVEWVDLDDLVPAFQRLAMALNPASTVVVMWANALCPSLQLQLGDVVRIAGAIFEEHETSRDVLVFSETEGWLIEMFHEGTLCLGRLSLPGGSREHTERIPPSR